MTRLVCLKLSHQVPILMLIEYARLVKVTDSVTRLADF